MTAVEFANPYLACNRCGDRVRGVRSGRFLDFNDPCGHLADYWSRCPSWGPVDGCTCPDPSHDHRVRIEP